MGGLAVVIDWERPVTVRELDPMLDLTPHRGAGGTRRVGFDHAALAESFFAHDIPDDSIVTMVGPLSIVGDLRLWNRDGLRARAGGATASKGMDDRRLLLEAYRRTGIDFLDDVDGDFAFIMWDDRARTVTAVRDRFGAKPLFFERTPTGIRLASEIKQLAATSGRPAEPCERSIAEHLTGRFEEGRFTYFEGIERVRPSTALIVDPDTQRTTRYWNPSPGMSADPPTGDVADGFREQLVGSIRRRLETSRGAIGHLTGGFDSSSIAASAHILDDRGLLAVPFETLSAIFPGYSNDESASIAEIAARQPFPHHDFRPDDEPLERLKQDMWMSDTPRPVLIDLWTGTTDAAHAADADLVLAGYGGDEVLDQYGLPRDFLRAGHLRRWAAAVHTYATWSDLSISRVAMGSMREAVPSSVKRRIRSIYDLTAPPADSLVPQELSQRLRTQEIEPSPSDYGYPSLTQNRVVSYTTAAPFAALLEHVETRYARGGLGVSYPFLDRTVVEYVASIPLMDRPFGRRTKSLVRDGFEDWLPRSVVNRRLKVVADDYFDAALGRRYPEFLALYPTVPCAARPYVDADRYDALLRDANESTSVFSSRESLWNAWTIMAWLEQLHQYGH